MKNDVKRLINFFCLFKTMWIPYIIVTLVVASRNFVITYINAMISSKAIAVVSSKASIVDSIVQIVIWVVCFAIMDAIGVYSQTTTIHKISVNLRKKMFSHALNVSVSDTDRFGRRDELVSRMNFDIDNAIGLLSYGLLSPIMCCISGIGATVIVFRENRKICVAIYVLGLFIFFAQLIFTRIIRKYMTSIQEERSDILSTSMQTFLNSTAIKMANMIGYVDKMYRSKIKSYHKIFARKGVMDGIYGVIQGAFGLFCFIGVFSYGLLGARMELETVVLISQITPLIATMILSLSDCIANVLKSMVGIDRILELLNLPIEEDTGDRFIIPPNLRGLETDGLICRYQDNEVRIGNIAVYPDDGNLIALKGPSGCGKTTLLRLLLKLYPYREGQLRFFGQDISNCSRSSVRENITYVPQENVIFPGTVRENILLGNHQSEITDKEIMNVLAKIGADEWIEGIGLDAQLKEDGVNLSGGQRQFVAIARAILYKKPILVLDESFASVDEEHILKIIAVLSEMQNDIYVIVVTHDNRVIQRCNTVVNITLERRTDRM